MASPCETEKALRILGRSFIPETALSDPPVGLRDYYFPSLLREYLAGRMPIFGLDMGGRCNLNCIMCSTYAGEPLPHELTKPEAIRVLEQAKDLGAGTVSIAGHGEPLLDPKLAPVIQRAHELDITPVIYTNGVVITPSLAELLKECEATVIVKLFSLDEDIHEALVGREYWPFYFALSGIRNLLDAGFGAQYSDSGVTDLGIETVVMNFNFADIEYVVEFARQIDALPVLDFLENTGKATEFFSTQAVSLGANRRLLDWTAERWGSRFFNPSGLFCPEKLSAVEVSADGLVRLGGGCGSCLVERARIEALPIFDVRETPLAKIYKAARDFRAEIGYDQSLERLQALLSWEFDHFPICPTQVSRCPEFTTS